MCCGGGGGGAGAVQSDVPTARVRVGRVPKTGSDTLGAASEENTSPPPVFPPPRDVRTRADIAPEALEAAAAAADDVELGRSCVEPKWGPGGAAGRGALSLRSACLSKCASNEAEATDAAEDTGITEPETVAVELAPTAAEGPRGARMRKPAEAAEYEDRGSKVETSVPAADPAAAAATAAAAAEALVVRCVRLLPGRNPENSGRAAPVTAGSSRDRIRPRRFKDIIGGCERWTAGLALPPDPLMVCVARTRLHTSKGGRVKGLQGEVYNR